ncbi:MAG TPA: hypothetical protein VMS77_07795 [Conexivisphaerales archaeon]|nr:hypothetical protein [Conexivisphaerales archaeon]
MKGTRLFSIVGGLILILAAFLPYGYSTWASGSTYDVTMKLVTNANSDNAMFSQLQQIGLTYTMSAIVMGMVIVAFFLFVVGGILALVKTGGGSVAGPVGAILLTIVPFLAGGSASDIFGLGIGYWLGWVGAIICVIGSLGKSKLEKVNLFVNQNQTVNVNSPPPAQPPAKQ